MSQPVKWLMWKAHQLVIAVYTCHVREFLWFPIMWNPLGTLCWQCHGRDQRLCLGNADCTFACVVAKIADCACGKAIVKWLDGKPSAASAVKLKIDNKVLCTKCKHYARQSSMFLIDDKKCVVVIIVCRACWHWQSLLPSHPAPTHSPYEKYGDIKKYTNNLMLSCLRQWTVRLRKKEEGETSEYGVDLEESLQDELCKLWDMAYEPCKDGALGSQWSGLTLTLLFT